MTWDIIPTVTWLCIFKYSNYNNFNYFYVHYRGITDPLIPAVLKMSAYCGRRTEFVSQSMTSALVHL